MDLSFFFIVCQLSSQLSGLMRVSVTDVLAFHHNLGCLFAEYDLEMGSFIVNDRRMGDGVTRT